MRYIPPFELIRSRYHFSARRGETIMFLPYEEFQNAIQALLLCVEVDEAWYLRQYVDVAEAIQSGAVKSAKYHFIRDGYFEGRLPFQIMVDEVWYLQQYPDVAKSVRSGIWKTAQQHFDDNGYLEGRLPYAIEAVAAGGPAPERWQVAKVVRRPNEAAEAVHEGIQE